MIDAFVTALEAKRRTGTQIPRIVRLALRGGVGMGGRTKGRVLPRVLLTGSEHPAGLAALRALDRAGYQVWAAVQSRSSLGARSRAAAGLVDVPDPRAAPNAFVSALAEAARRLRVAAVLPGTEAALLALAGRTDEFSGPVAVGSATETALRRATDKVAL